MSSMPTPCSTRRLEDGSDGVRHKGSLRAAFTLWYTSGDSTADLAEAVQAMLGHQPREVSLKSGSWEQVERRCTPIRC